MLKDKSPDERRAYFRASQARYIAQLSPDLRRRRWREDQRRRRAKLRAENLKALAKRIEELPAPDADPLLCALAACAGR
ncbi:MAG: hypothetical protein J0I31_11580 [Rhizobiales bacterium]|nr:hypothetical protein [Hyphomicrobiales bacterium]